MTALRVLSRFSAHRPRFAANQRGVSSVEFALLLPVMFVMYLGSIVVIDLITVDRQVTLMASTVAEITSQSTTLTTSQVTNILNAAGLVLNGGQSPTPFPIANAQVTISSVRIDATTASARATIDWSQALTGNGRATNSVVTSSIPSGILNATPNTISWVIWGEASYNFTPLAGSAVWTGINGAQPLYDQIFVRPRQSNCVNLTGTTGC